MSAALPPNRSRLRRRSRQRLVGRLALAGAMTMVGTAALATEATEQDAGPTSGESARTVSVGPDERLALGSDSGVLSEELDEAIDVGGSGDEELFEFDVDVTRTSPAEPAVAPEPQDDPEPAATAGSAVEPEPTAEPGPAAEPTARIDVWERLAQCESGGNWSIDTGNGYYGGLQFNHESWHWAGGDRYSEYPHHATKAQQIEIAERLLEIHPAGWSAWPACSAELGLN